MKGSSRRTSAARNGLGHASTASQPPQRKTSRELIFDLEFQRSRGSFVRPSDERTALQRNAVVDDGASADEPFVIAFVSAGAATPSPHPAHEGREVHHVRDVSRSPPGSSFRLLRRQAPEGSPRRLSDRLHLDRSGHRALGRLTLLTVVARPRGRQGGHSSRPEHPSRNGLHRTIRDILRRCPGCFFRPNTRACPDTMRPRPAPRSLSAPPVRRAGRSRDDVPPRRPPRRSR